MLYVQDSSRRRTFVVRHHGLRLCLIMESKVAETMEKAIRSLYEAGCPLFTKKSIADVSQQLKQKMLQVFSVKGLDGKTYTTNLSTEDIQSYEDELEFYEYVPFPPPPLHEYSAKGLNMSDDKALRLSFIMRHFRHLLRRLSPFRHTALYKSSNNASCSTRLLRLLYHHLSRFSRRQKKWRGV